jgi:hypothetical protein
MSDPAAERRRVRATSSADGSPTLTVRVGSDSVDVRVPEGFAVVVGSQSGQVELKGRFGSVGVSSSSGRRC